MFSGLSQCRFALFYYSMLIKIRVIPDLPEMMFIGLYMMNGCVVLMAESDKQYWWSQWLQPNVHYIPVKVKTCFICDCRVIYRI